MAEIINGIQVNFLNVYRNTLRFENAKVFFLFTIYRWKTKFELHTFFNRK